MSYPTKEEAQQVGAMYCPLGWKFIVDQNDGWNVRWRQDNRDAITVYECAEPGFFFAMFTDDPDNHKGTGCVYVESGRARRVEEAAAKTRANAVAAMNKLALALARA